MIEVHTDAACSGDPGLSAAGIVIKADNQIEEHQFFLGTWSNHEAEFLAVAVLWNCAGLYIQMKSYPSVLIQRSLSILWIENIRRIKSSCRYLNTSRSWNKPFHLFFINGYQINKTAMQTSSPVSVC